MHTFRLFSRATLLAASTAAALWFVVNSESRAAAGPLLQAVSSDRLSAAAESPSERGVIRSRHVTIDFAQLPGAASRRMLREPPLTLELFPDVTLFAEFQRLDTSADGVSWVGRVEHSPLSSVTLSYGGGLMAGSIALRDRFYQIRPASPHARDAYTGGGELHIVTQVDQSSFLPELPPIEVNAPPLARSFAAGAHDTAGTIDLLVLFTPAAAAANGGTTGIQNLINLGVSETNTSYANSDVAQRLRLVGTAPIDYVEPNNLNQSLNVMRAGISPFTGVPALRDSLNADMVMLITRPPVPNACGVAFLMSSISAGFEASAYSVVDASCISPNYTFAHELGHNMGARHDWFMDNETTPFSYAHGYVNPAVGERWRTIMAYPDMCSVQGFSCTRLLYWANAEKRYAPACDSGRFNCNLFRYWNFGGPRMGVPAGTAANCPPGNFTVTNCDADDSRVLNTTAVTVANFRQGGT